MSLVRKLKPDRNIIGPLIPLSMLLIWGISSLLFDLPTTWIILAALMWVYSLFYLIVFARTGNLTQLFIFVYAVFAGVILASLASYFDASRIERLEFRLAYTSGLVFFGSVLIYLALTRKLKWRGREIFELAAEPVEETGNGYTSRPRPVGKVEYSPQQMRSFARFCARHLIALPYYTSKNITLVPIKMGEEFGRVLGLSGDYRDATWVNFDVNGDVAVHIAQVDYLDYREPLAFDQLCTSLGQVFIDFFELYKKGEGVRVIDRMDDLKIGILS
jgi:hypothetical protein